MTVAEQALTIGLATIAAAGHGRIASHRRCVMDPGMTGNGMPHSVLGRLDDPRTGRLMLCRNQRRKRGKHLLAGEQDQQQQRQSPNIHGQCLATQ
ncbi:MAG: hypothetical protein CMK32_10730 [Porticoccaceae bacterium]|nr:hypothetical protein [Porticoccaceae bacterium]